MPTHPQTATPWTDEAEDVDGVPEDSARAWMSLLYIGLIAGACATLLYAAFGALIA